jgi:signal transduction histidine kinase
MTASPTDDNASLEHRNRELTKELSEAREQQAATAGILAAISNARTDPYRVFAEIAESAARLCDADNSTIAQLIGDRLSHLARHGPLPTDGPLVESALPFTRGSVAARAIIDRQTIHVADLQAETDEYPIGSELARRFGHRSILVVPLMRACEAIGSINVRRAEVRPFTDRHIGLLRIFADQAVIAIENTRLFEAEQASKRELQESLEYQTAISDVLNVISRSPTDVQPVFDMIAKSAMELCHAEFCNVFRFDGQLVHFVAAHGTRPEARRLTLSRFPVPPGRGFAAGRAILSNTVEELPDVSADADFALREIAKAGAYGSIVAVPMKKDGSPIGALAVGRSQVGPFPSGQIDLLKTFADQAVIAIENTRLFEAEQASKRELVEALEQQTATAEVLGAISRSKFELQPVLDTLVASASHLCDAPMVAIHVQRIPTESAPATMAGLVHASLPGRARFGFSGEVVAALANITQVMGRGSLAGRTILEGRPVHIPNVEADAEYAFHDFTHITGARSMLGLPLLRDGSPIGLLSLYRTQVAPFTERQIELLQTFTDQAVIAIENARLFEEVQERTRELAHTVEELEIASQHKSQFVANMSHELRTPLAAILGYAELIQEGFYGPQPEKSMDALTRIRSNGKHLLSLINTVLDIAKIESGQFTLNMTEYAIESVVETVRAATESLAQNKKLALKTEVAKSLPIGLGDEQRLTQVLLNLVGNAIKFTDTGEVRVTAKAVNGQFNVSVTDTGPGIPEEHQARIFEQFHQVDSSNTKAKGGTGLGLAIAKQIVEMHGGRIWVASTLGKGSTFQMELPTRAELRKPAS